MALGIKSRVLGSLFLGCGVMTQMRTLIVDDEWLIRTELRAMLMPFHEIVVVGEAATVEEARLKLLELKPDLVFLDIHLPDGSGFDLLKESTLNFKLVFITAHDQYWIEAKKYRAVDYLLKPVSKNKLSRVIQKCHLAKE